MEKSDDAIQAYLFYKQGKYSASLEILNGDNFDKDSIAVQHNEQILSFLQDGTKEYDRLYKKLESLLKKLTAKPNELNKSMILSKTILMYNMAVLLSLQQKYSETETMIQSILNDNKNVETSIQLRCYLLLIELYFSLYHIRGETKDWLHQQCFPIFSQIEPLFKEPFPDYIKNRLQFRYHIYRTLYFLEQGSVKGVKKEVKNSSDFYSHIASESESSYINSIHEVMNSQDSLCNLALDGLDQYNTIDGYLPSILKTRLEFRRGNCMKIISVMNQVYENDDATRVPSKDSFYYCMLSSVYYCCNMLNITKYYLIKAFDCCKNEHCNDITKGSILKDLGIVNMMMNASTESMDCFQQALRYLPMNVSIWFRYAEVCYHYCRQSWLDANANANVNFNSVQHETYKYLKEALIGYKTVIHLYQQRHQTTSLLLAAELQAASIYLEMKRFSSCIALCSTITTQLHESELQEEEGITISPEVINITIALYCSECYYNQHQLDKAIDVIVPLNHPDMYPEIILTIVKEEGIKEDQGKQLEEWIQSNTESSIEMLIYNLTLLYIQNRDWKNAQLYCDILTHFQASMKNAKLKIYLLQQMGKHDEVKRYMNEFLIKYSFVCFDRFFLHIPPFRSRTS